MDLTEIVAELKKLKPEDVVNALSTELNNEVYQPIYRRGFSAKTEEVKTEFKQKDAEIARLTKETSDRDAKIAELQKATPDVDTIKKEYEEKLTAKDEEWKAKLSTAEQALTGERGQTDEAALRSSLLAQNLDPDWAETQVYKLLHVDKRVTRDAEGKRKVYQADKATPIPEAEGKTPLQILAAEVHGTAPDWAKKSRVQQGGPGSPGGPLGGSDFDSIRTAEKARIESQSKNGVKSAASLLGMNSE
jgi:hypothetical protein